MKNLGVRMQAKWLWVVCALMVGPGACAGDNGTSQTNLDVASESDTTLDARDDSTTDDAGHDAQNDAGFMPQPTWHAALTLPDYPFWESDGLALDRQQLEVLADEYCASKKAAGNAPEFFYGTLPLWAVGGLCPASSASEGPVFSSDPEVVKGLLGWMYLSGYYGGVWFRDNADFGMSMPGGDGEGEGGPEPGPVTEEDFQAIALNAADLRKLAVDGAAQELFAHNFEALKGTGSLMDALMTSLLTVFAYNYGYVQAVLAKPPEGVLEKPAFPCSDYLSCKLAKSPLAHYAVYESALPLLKNPVGTKWQALAAEVDKSKTWISIGKSLWSEGSISPEAWGVLVLINAGYLQVSAAAALASMLGYGEDDEAAGRCGTLLEAAADTWNQAYFLALRSDAPVGSAPVLVCLESE